MKLNNIINVEQEVMIGPIIAFIDWLKKKEKKGAQFFSAFIVAHRATSIVIDQ